MSQMLQFRCCIEESGERCRLAKLVDAGLAKAQGWVSTKYICEKHLERGYRWMHSLLEDPRPDVGLVLPSRAKDLSLVRGQDNAAADLLRSYGKVQEFFATDARGQKYIEDVLLLRLEDAKDPSAPVVEVDGKKVFPSFTLTKPKLKD